MACFRGVNPGNWGIATPKCWGGAVMGGAQGVVNGSGNSIILHIVQKVGYLEYRLYTLILF